MADTLNIEERHKKAVPDWAVPFIRQHMANVTNLTYNWTNALGFPTDPSFPSIDFHLEQARMDGGRLLWAMINRIRGTLQCSGARMGTAMNGEGCDYLRGLKFYAYSAHEINLSQLLASFNFTRTNFDTDGIPPVATCITLELWQTAPTTSTSGSSSNITTNYYVRAFHWDPDSDGDPVEITWQIDGCSNEAVGVGGCSLKQFIQRSKPYRMMPSAKAYCANMDGLGNMTALSGGGVMGRAGGGWRGQLCLLWVLLLVVFMGCCY